MGAEDPSSNKPASSAVPSYDENFIFNTKDWNSNKLTDAVHPSQPQLNRCFTLHHSCFVAGCLRGSQ